MNNQNNKPINPFEAALERGRSGVVVSLQVHDVLSACGETSETAARDFLYHHCDAIAREMIWAGRMAIIRIWDESHGK